MTQKPLVHPLGHLDRGAAFHRDKSGGALIAVFELVTRQITLHQPQQTARLI
jgi:hypothetical protein